MFDALINTLFGCSHKRTSFPLTPSRRNGFQASNYSGQKRTGNMYVTCLDCGKEFDYNWEEMRVGQAVRAGTAARAESFSVVK